MVRVIGCVSGKGGSGKSKTNLGVACAVAMSPNRPRVLLVDICQDQGMLSFMFSEKKNRSGVGIGSILTGLVAGRSTAWAIQQFEEALDTLVVSHEGDVRIDFLPAAARVVGELSLHGWKESKHGALLSTLVAAIQDRYDYMIFDTVPLVRIHSTASVLAIADAVVVVLDVQKYQNVGGLRDFLQDIREYGANVIGVVQNLYDPKLAASRLAKIYVDGICAGAGIPIIEVIKRSGSVLNSDDVFTDDTGSKSTGTYIGLEADPSGRSRILAVAKQFENIAGCLKDACAELEAVSNG